MPKACYCALPRHMQVFKTLMYSHYRNFLRYLILPLVGVFVVAIVVRIVVDLARPIIASTTHPNHPGNQCAATRPLGNGAWPRAGAQRN